MSRSAWCRQRPAARAGSTSISAPRRNRCGSPPGSARTIPAASPARPASSTSTTPPWTSTKAARPSRIGWRTPTSPRNMSRRSSATARRTAWTRSSTTRTTRANCRRRNSEYVMPANAGIHVFATHEDVDGRAKPGHDGQAADFIMPVIEQGADGERIYFSSTGRSLVDEDEICVLSVGVDIGSSTSHLVFSRIVLERLDSRYVVTERETFYQSDILLTPYAAEEEIDAEALGAFIARQYKDAKIDPDEIDTGALILTGVAVRRRNARPVGELFAAQAGKRVAVSAGDSLETVMAAYGSGAAARSIRSGAPLINVDIGGGTSKIAVCAEGKGIDVTALDVGARLVVLDDARRIVRLEEAGRRFGAELGLAPATGAVID